MRKFGLSLLALIASQSYASSNKSCELLKQQKLSPAIKAYLYQECSFLARPSFSERPYYEFFSKVRRGNWGSYSWKLNRSQWEELLKAGDWISKNPGLKPVFIIEKISKDFSEGQITNKKAFESFLIRVLPCTDGEQSTGLAQMLGKLAEEHPRSLAESLIAEDREVNRLAKAAKLDSCAKELKDDKMSLSAYAGLMLSAELPDEKKELFKNQFSPLQKDNVFNQPEVKAFMDMLL